MRRGALVTLGETMGRISADGVGLLGSAGSLTLSIAGAESNVAVAAVRLGGEATWVGRVGTDAVGDLIERRLRAEGVRTRITRDAAGTGLMLSYRRTSGGTHVDYHRSGSAGSRLSAADLPVADIESAGVLHVTGVTPALSTSAREAVLRAVQIARAAGVPVSVDVNHRRKLWEPAVAAPVLRALVESADIVFAGPAEAALVLGARSVTPLDAAHALAALGPSQCIVKDGPRGASAVVDGESFVLPAPAVDAVDPVGAGDAFVAGYLVELLDGRVPAIRLDTAIRTGAYAVTVPGDCENLPFRHELDSFAAAEEVDR